MKDLYKTLATDAYLNAVEVIRAEKKEGCTNGLSCLK